MKQFMNPTEKIFPWNCFSPCKARNLVRKHVQEVCARPPTDLFNTCQEPQDAKWASGFLCPDELFASQQGQQVQPQDKGPFHFSCFPAPLLCLPVSLLLKAND